jgi:hypothetical protein
MWNAIKYDYTWVRDLVHLRKEYMVLWLQPYGAQLVVLHVGKWNCYTLRWPIWKSESLLMHHSWKIK